MAGQRSALDLADEYDPSTLGEDTDATFELGAISLPPSLGGAGALAGAAVLTDSEADGDGDADATDVSPRRPLTASRRRGDVGTDPQADAEVEQFIAALEGVGEEAAVRLMKAQLRTMSAELEATHADLKQAKARATSAEKEAKTLAADKTKLDKALQAAKTAAAKQAAAAADAEKRGSTVDTQLKALQKELDVLGRAQKKNDSKSSSLQVRLNRTTEELEAARREVSRLRATSTSSGGELRAKYDAEVRHAKVLTTQKDELIAAFKKQQQLIDILKRQKLHVEAARLLQFSEEEFVKALDWGK